MTETGYAHFELRRLSAELVYHFDRQPLPDGRFGYKRQDQELWIVFNPELGWVAYDDENGVTGRPWNVLPKDQTSDHPPEGEWVSKKGVKSYVYDLRYQR
jgi:hypothetical protein